MYLQTILLTLQGRCKVTVPEKRDKKNKMYKCKHTAKNIEIFPYVIDTANYGINQNQCLGTDYRGRQIKLTTVWR